MSKYILAISISVFIVLMGIGTENVLGKEGKENVMNNDVTIGNAAVDASRLPTGGILGMIDNKTYNGVDNFNLTNYQFYLPYDSYVYISAAGSLGSDQLVDEVIKLFLDGNYQTSTEYDFITNIDGGCWNGCRLPFQLQTVKYLQKGNHNIQLEGFTAFGSTTFSDISIAVIYFQNGHIE